MVRRWIKGCHCQSHKSIVNQLTNQLQIDTFVTFWSDILFKQFQLIYLQIGHFLKVVYIVGATTNHLFTEKYRLVIQNILDLHNSFLDPWCSKQQLKLFCKEYKTSVMSNFVCDLSHQIYFLFFSSQYNPMVQLRRKFLGQHDNTLLRVFWFIERQN